MKLLNFLRHLMPMQPQQIYYLELLAVVLGIISVWFAKKEHILVFPTGIISTCVLCVHLLSIYTLRRCYYKYLLYINEFVWLV